MPRYTYKCEECEVVHEVRHSMSEEYTNCDDIQTEKECRGTLVKVPSSFMGALKKNSDTVKKVGEVTNKSIEEFKEDLKQEKQNLKSNLYEHN